jgi:hypothetical protein
MMRITRRIGRRLIDLLVWSLVFCAGTLVGTWWASNGPSLVARLAAWSEPKRDADKAPVPATMGPRKRAWFERRTFPDSTQAPGGRLRPEGMRPGDAAVFERHP